MRQKEDASFQASNYTVQGIIELLPDDWQVSSGHAFVTSYRMLGVSVGELSPPFGVQVGTVCIVMGWFGLPHLSVKSEHEYTHDGQIRINVKAGGGEPRRLEPIALFIVESDRGDTQALTSAHERCHEAIGLLSAIVGLSAAFEHVEDYWLSFTTQMLEPVPVLIYDPLWITETHVDESSRQRWSAADELISRSAERERISLSLRWFDDGKRNRGIDSLLKLWFALETLAMPDTTNIRPIKEALAAIYEIPRTEVERHFGVGRILGLRSRIVHSGYRPEVSASLLRLVAGIYLDMFCYVLGAESPRRSQAAVDEAGGLESVWP